MDPFKRDMLGVLFSGDLPCIVITSGRAQGWNGLVVGLKARCDGLLTNRSDDLLHRAFTWLHKFNRLICSH
ncbi:MAG: hypothetical protein HW416_3513, partial [Chloroflexi bacterium]|nr:hypothetical protein [Chloroflexota bacterium]